MMTLSDKEYRDILDTVYTLNSCEDKESFLDTLMPSLVQMFHTDCITFQLIQGYPWHIKVVESRSFKSASHSLSEDKFYPELYKENFYHQSPLLKEAISSSKMIFKLGESISLKDWERTEMYNRFIAPQNLYWEMFLSLRWKNNLEGMITLWRSKDQGNYGGGDMQKAELLAPHLSVAARNASASERIAFQKSKLVANNDSDTEGLLLLDYRFKPLYFNTTAQRICLQINNRFQAASSHKADNDFTIPGCIILDCAELLHLLKTDERPILWPKERLLLNGNGQKFQLECSLIWKANQINSQPNFIVILNEITSEQPSDSLPPTRYPLSKRELDIIYYLNQAMSYEEIAEKLIISKQTVHTHVKNIYRKLGAKNRIELYRYVHSLTWLK
jgi:DNA-binding CsgD family transcriptional regulator